MLVEAFLRRLVVVRRHGEEARGAASSHLAGEVNHAPGVVSAGSREHRHLPIGFVDDDLDDEHPLGVSERGVLTSCSAGTEKMYARVDLPLGQPSHCRFVEVAGLRERRHQRGSHTGKWNSHVCSPAGLPASAKARRSAVASAKAEGLHYNCLTLTLKPAWPTRPTRPT